MKTNTKHNLRIRLFVSTLTLFMPFTGVAVHAEEGTKTTPIPRKAVPSVVLRAYAKAYPQAKASGYARVERDGETRYDIKSTQKGKTRSLYYYYDAGRVVKVAEVIAPTILPLAVRRAIQKTYPAGRATKAEKVIQGSTVTYEAWVRNGTKTVEMALTPVGRILPPEKHDEERKKD